MLRGAAAAGAVARSVTALHLGIPPHILDVCAMHATPRVSWGGGGFKPSMMLRGALHPPPPKCGRTTTQPSACNWQYRLANLPHFTDRGWCAPRQRGGAGVVIFQQGICHDKPHSLWGRPCDDKHDAATMLTPVGCGSVVVEVLHCARNSRRPTLQGQSITKLCLALLRGCLCRFICASAGVTCCIFTDGQMMVKGRQVHTPTSVCPAGHFNMPKEAGIFCPPPPPPL